MNITLKIALHSIALSVNSKAGMKIHGCSCSRCSIIYTKHVFAFVRVRYFLKQTCSCSFVFNILRKTHVRLRSCSGEHKRTLMFAQYVFVFFHPCSKASKIFHFHKKEDGVQNIKGVNFKQNHFASKLLRIDPLFCHPRDREAGRCLSNV